MPVVSNTSTVLNLAIIDRLALLRDQFGSVWIPRAVLDELRLGEDLPGCRVLREAIEAGWLRVVDIESGPLVLALQRDLDGGEAEAIALAVQTGAQLVLLDERDARKAAKSQKLRVTGLLGVLLKAKREGRIASFRAAAQELRDRAGFRIGARLLSALLERSGESDGQAPGSD